MKKLIILAVTFVMLLSLVLPSVALAVSGSVTVATGGGSIPVVKCKWEQEPPAQEATLESGDKSHAVPGFQINPPVKKCAQKTIEYYAVVTDVEDGGAVSQAFADVYHPTGSPEPYGPSKVGGIPNLPYFKYEVPFVDLQAGSAAITKDQAKAIVQSAYDKGLICGWGVNTTGTAPVPYTITDVIYELDKGTAHLWKGTAVIDYEQPAGLYNVYVFAVDNNNNISPAVTNQFKYMPIAGIEADFTAIDWGSVNLGFEKMIPGDLVWNIPAGINKATVRNIGNTWASLTVKFDDMGFGQDVNGTWNVNFDVRMGSDDTYYIGSILPYQLVTTTNALGLSKMNELDLSIKILKGFGTHTGVITLGQIVRDFNYDPAKVDGIASPCDPKDGG